MRELGEAGGAGGRGRRCRRLSELAGILVRMSDSIKLGSVALECTDARKLAAFYAEIMGGSVVYADEEWAAVKGPGGQARLPDRPRL